MTQSRVSAHIEKHRQLPDGLGPHHIVITAPLDKEPRVLALVSPLIDLASGSELRALEQIGSRRVSLAVRSILRTQLKGGYAYVDHTTQHGARTQAIHARRTLN